MYKLVAKLGLLNCYRCGYTIENLKDFSIDHKQPWLDSKHPIETFFSLKNIAFSHSRCNTMAGRRSIKYPQFIGRRRQPNKYFWDSKRVYDPKKRKKQYERTGK